MAFLGEVGRESVSGGVGRSEGRFTGAGTTSTATEDRSRGLVTECVEEARTGAGGVGSGMEARPALMPTDVCTHRRKGDEWTTTLNLRRFLRGPSTVAASSWASLSRSSSPILCPVARAWFHPLYVRGGS